MVALSDAGHDLEPVDTTKQPRSNLRNESEDTAGSPLHSRIGRGTKATTNRGVISRKLNETALCNGDATSIGALSETPIESSTRA